MHTIAWYRISPIIFLAFLPLSILWKGGKSLETTWILIAVAWFCTLTFWQRQRVHPDDTQRTPRTLWVPLTLFLCWTFVSYLTSQTGNYGLDEVLRDSSLVLLFLWFFREASREAWGAPLYVRVLQVLIVSTAAAAALGVAVYILQPVPRFVGSFFDPRFHTDYWPNAWAELVLMVWPLTVCLQAHSEMQNVRSGPEPVQGRMAKCKIPLQLLLRSLLLASLFLSYSRAAYLALSLQLALWGFFYWKQRGEHARNTWNIRTFGRILVLLCFSGGIVLSINALRVGLSPVESITEKITFAAAEGTSSITERVQFWQQAWQLLWERPLLGWGPYSFRFVQTRLQEGVFATSDHAHNIFLKYASERGLPAAVLFGIFLVTLLLPTIHTLLRRASFPPPLLLPLTVSLAGVLFHLLLDFNMQFVGVALPFWLLLALLANNVMQNEECKMKSVSLSIPLLRCAEVSLATILMLLALFEGRFLVLSSLGRHAETRGDYGTALTWYERARGETFSRDLHLSRAHLALLQGHPHDALRALDDYFRTNRHDARAWKLLGDAKKSLSDLPAARAAYEEALHLGKWNHLGALHGLLEVLLAQKEKNAIMKRQEEFDFLLTAYLDAMERNAHFIALTPNVEEFLAITRALTEVFPQDAPRYQAMGAKADREAQEERSRLAARPVGRLW